MLGGTYEWLVPWVSVRRTLRTILIACLGVATTLGSGGAAWAYNNQDNSCWWNNTTPLYVSYKWGADLQTPGTLWRNAFNDGVANWNTAPVKPILILDSSNSKNTLDTYYALDGKWGRSWIYCNIFYKIDRFDAKGNTAYSMNDQQRAEIASHEVGHGLGLGHSWVTPSVMHYTGPYGTWGVPRQDDINGLNSMYP